MFLKFPQVFQVCSLGREELPQAMGERKEGFKQGSNNIRFLTTCSYFNVKQILWLRRPLGKETLLYSPGLGLFHCTMKILLTNLKGCCKDCISSLPRVDEEYTFPGPR